MTKERIENGKKKQRKGRKEKVLKRRRIVRSLEFKIHSFS